MKYYLNLFVLSLAVTGVNILLFIILLQFQIIHNSGYIPQELITFALILIALPFEFIVLIIVDLIFKKDKKALKITSGILVLTCFIFLWIDSAESRATFNNELVYKATERHNYTQAISTPEGYPVKLLSESKFDLAVKGDNNATTLLETGKVYSNIWGVGKSTFNSIEEGGLVLPDRMKLFWYSYVEDKYYGLDTPINKQKISRYFKKGFKWDTNSTMTNAESTDASYENLTAGIAPGGEVVLWVTSSSNTKEIEIFKAKEINVSKFKIYDIVSDEDRKSVLKDTCECKDNRQYRRIVNTGKPIPFGKWTNKYRKKFNWKVNINNFGQNRSVLELYFFNGERDELYTEDVGKMTYHPEVLPDYLNFIFSKDKIIYTLHLKFDENEIYRKFEELTQLNKNEPIDLAIVISADLKEAKISLRSPSKILSFKKIEKVEKEKR